MRVAVLKWKDNQFVSHQFSPDLIFDSCTYCLYNLKVHLIDEVQLLPPRPNCLWFATSGSTDQPKWVAMPKPSLIASAKAINDFFSLNKSDRFLNVLPTFHVGGLGIIARAALVDAMAVDRSEGAWDPALFAQAVSDLGVTVSSLVPTQVYDLVAHNLEAPSSLRFIFVGGGELDSELYFAARSLKWPLIPSYGMTETASMIAAAAPETLKNNEFPALTVLPHAEVKVDTSGHALVRASSFASGYFLSGEKTFTEFEANGWFRTDDVIELSEGQIVSIQRSSDRVKIKGELISLTKLSNSLKAFLNVDCRVASLPDVRDGYRLVACLKASDWSQVAGRYSNWINQRHGIERPQLLMLLREWPVNSMGKWNHAQFLANFAD